VSLLKPPSQRDIFKELRTWEVFPKLAVSLPRLGIQERGAGQPIMVVPGFGASDSSTRVLRAYLQYLGYKTVGWGLGRNRGDVPRLLEMLTKRVAEFCQRQGTPVRLVGWSLGGYLAREVARDRADLVNRVITLGSPVVGGPKYTAAGSYYQKLGHDLDEIEALVEERYLDPITVPVTAIYSRSDGIVSWRACLDERSPDVEHVEVTGSHLSLGFSPEVLRIIADRLRAPKLNEDV
jgi:pimeloyl-ACP methyl ester carboxylesterase